MGKMYPILFSTDFVPSHKKIPIPQTFLARDWSDVLKETCLYIMKDSPAAPKLAFPINFS